MKNKKTITILITGAVIAAVTFGAIASRSVFAAEPTVSTIANEVQATANLGRGPMGGFSREDLANALGITIDELTSAYQEAYAAALDQAVADGLITQVQADQLASNGKAFPFGDRWNGFLKENGIDFNTFLADALGISVDKLSEAFHSAYFTNIDQAMTDGKITQEQADLMKGRYALTNDSTFQSSMKSAYTDAVNAAVASGVITQSQADQILSKSANLFMNGFGGLGGPGGHRGHGFNWIGGNDLPIAP